jgi:hypothetical protein
MDKEHLDERERWIAGVLREAAARERAPQRLRTAIERERRSVRPSPQRRLVFGGALASAVAALIVALALVLPAGTPGAPSISQAASLALKGPEAPAPAPDPTAPTANLGRNVEDVYFPNWTRTFGWRAVGQRTDRIHGRTAVTIYYRSDGHTLAYTILSAPALKVPAAPVTVLNRTELRTLRLDGRLVVTWRRAGHTCVLSAAGVSAGQLQRLAAWGS